MFAFAKQVQKHIHKRVVVYVRVMDALKIIRLRLLIEENIARLCVCSS